LLRFVNFSLKIWWMDGWIKRRNFSVRACAGRLEHWIKFISIHQVAPQLILRPMQCKIAVRLRFPVSLITSSHWFLQRDVMHKHSLCRAVSVRLSICLSACLSRSWILSKQIIVSSLFSPSGSHIILDFFRIKRRGNIIIIIIIIIIIWFCIAP